MHSVKSRGLEQPAPPGDGSGQLIEQVELINDYPLSSQDWLTLCPTASYVPDD